MILWIMTACQLLASAWFAWKGGKLKDREFFIYTGAMMMGQLALGYETFSQEATRALVIQIYSLILTIIGGIQRYRIMQTSKSLVEDNAKVSEN